MIKGTTDVFETLAQASKPAPYQNLSEKECQEICDVYFKSSLEMAIASLQSGLTFAKKTNNIKLVKLLERDIETFVQMHAEREAKNVG